MKKLFLTIAIAFAIHANAQLNHVGIGYGPMNFPGVHDPVTGEQLMEGTQGGAAYLSFGLENDKVRTIGGQLIIAGNSRISYGGETYGYGAVGGVAFTELNITKNGFLRFGVFAGGLVFQQYERVDLTQGQFADPAAGFSNNQKLKDTNFQPFGGVKLGVGPVEIQYAPAGNTIMFGVRLFKGN